MYHIFKERVMFTGIVETVGIIKEIHPTDKGKTFIIESPEITDDLNIGDSISVNGVCLTATKIEKSKFYIDLVMETLKKSNLGEMKKLSRVNLERSITLSTRLGGHILQGHVETTSVILKKKKIELSAELTISIDSKFLKYCIPKGSIALDGISLTIAEINKNLIKIAVIPHTLENTNLGFKEVGDSLNVETDIIGKYIERLLKFENKNYDLNTYRKLKR
jgi:riboflavin synthase|tara:strand:+ start:891 stop:1550 length:660 start_codon:yes stop_codon:yes gene_type:complete